jgi:hypothetical protein
MEDSKHPGHCKCPHHLIIPVATFLIGAAFLFMRLGSLDLRTVSYIWPVMLMIIGVAMLGKRFCTCCAQP